MLGVRKDTDSGHPLQVSGVVDLSLNKKCEKSFERASGI